MTSPLLSLPGAVAGNGIDGPVAAHYGSLYGEQVTLVVKEKAAAYGVELIEAGVRDLILPGDMKAILNQVMEAKKKSEAALILRREEVAATRSLANTAELLAQNPALMKLKELEAHEKVAARGATIVVAPETFGLGRELVK
jgi:regulator of protease activity HflC (stomatin/prohibitin superfamily)